MLLSLIHGTTILIPKQVRNWYKRAHSLPFFRKGERKREKGKRKKEKKEKKEEKEEKEKRKKGRKEKKRNVFRVRGNPSLRLA